MKVLYLLLLISTFKQSLAAEYFIADDGNDDGQGSFSEPWKTLSHGIAQLQAGDTLTIRGGVYRLIEETNLSIINTPNITIQGYPDENVRILGSYSTVNDTWEAYSTEIWRIPVSQLNSDPKGMFIGHTRIQHQTNDEDGRNHDHVSNLVSRNHWTKADANGVQCFEDNSGCYIYLLPQPGQNPNDEIYEISQRSLARVINTAHHITVKNLRIYYTQSSPIFFQGADYVTLENNVFAHVSNGNDNSYGVRIWDSQGSLVKGNTVYDSVYWGGVSNSKGITFMITKPGEPNVVEYNEIYDIPGRSAVGVKGGVSNLIVRYNYIHDVYNAFEPGSYRCVWSSTNTDGCQQTDSEYRPAGGWEIYGNIIENAEIGLRLPGHNEDNNNNRLYNNVLYNVNTGVEIGWDGTFGTKIANNIFIDNEVGIYLNSGATTTAVNDYLDQFESHHNLYFNNRHADIHLRPNWNGDYYSGTSYDLLTFQALFTQREAQSISADPEFANLHDYYLLGSSQAVNAGDGSFWGVASVHMGAHPFTTLTDLIFTDSFD